MGQKSSDIQTGKSNEQQNRDTKKFADRNGEDFYHDLDRKKSHQSCCTCQTLVLFFIGLLLIIFGAIFFIYFKVNETGGLNINFRRNTLASNFNDKMNNPSTDVVGDYTVTIISDELNSILSGGLNFQDFILKDTTININPNDILVYGNLIQPFDSKIVLTLVPEVKDYKFILKVNKITAGNVTLPNLIDNNVERNLNSLMDKKMANFYRRFNVKSVNLGDEQILIKGEPKN